MKIAIIECFNNSKGAKAGNSTLAHIKNNKIIANYLKCPYFITEDELRFAAAEKWDVLLFTNSSAFADHKGIKRVLQNNESARKLFITNEYTASPHSELAKYKHEVISNFNGKKTDYFLNLNSLMARKPLPLTEKKYDCIYWGACRDGRKKYLQEYLKRGIYLSTTPKAKKSFLEIGCTPTFVQQIDWKKSITQLFRYSLYIEDEFTHKVFNNLANRWYEAGIYNNVTFFDKSCASTIALSEIANVYDKFYTVGSYEELLEKIQICNKDYQKHLKAQSRWHEIDLLTKDKVLGEIKKILEA